MCLSAVLTSLGPMVLEVDFSGATTEDITQAGTLCVSLKECADFGCQTPAVEKRKVGEAHKS